MPSEKNIQGLATLLVLQDDVKKLKTLTEFGFFTTNETYRLLPYHTAYLWQKRGFSNAYLLAQSGVAEIDIHAPVNQWLKEEISRLQSSEKAKTCYQVDYQNQRHNFSDILPGFLLWCPLFDASQELSGGLLLFREFPFSDQDIKMLSWLMNNYQYTWLVLVKNNKNSFIKSLKQKTFLKVAVSLVIITALFPIRLSVLANAVVVSKKPVYINAGIPGIIREFLVKPGERVKIGQPLVLLDKRDLLNQLAVDQKKLLLTEAKLRTAVNAGLEKPEYRSEILVLQAQLAVDKAELDFTDLQLSKATLTSPIEGVAVFDNKEDWVGQPVLPGDNILTIADPENLELKIQLNISDLIQLKMGSEGKFYLYGQLKTIPVRLVNIGYNAKVFPGKNLAYPVTASFINTSNLPRLGSQGKVKLYGDYVPFIYYLIRRPLETFRQTFGI